jgi:tyrosyl-tRNA synthetase
MVHGETGVRSAERISAALFSDRVRDLTEDDLEQLRQDGMPSGIIANNEPQLVAVLVASQLATSRGAARKLIQTQSIQVNGQLVFDDDAILSGETALHGRFHLIRRGKKSWYLAIHA